MKRRDGYHACGLLVSVVGSVQAINHVSTALVAAFMVAITSKNLSPLWAAKKVMEGAANGVRILITWYFPDSGHSISAELVKEDGVVKLEGGGLGYDGFDPDRDGQSPGEITGTVSGSVATRVEYGPKQVMHWLAAASEGPEKVGETEPTKPVPGEPYTGACNGVVGGFGEGVETRVNPWR